MEPTPPGSADNRRREDIPPVQPIEAPRGVNLRPAPRRVVRVSRRAGIVIGVVLLALLGLVGYAGWRRTQTAQAEQRGAGLPTHVSPATQAGAEVLKDVSAGNTPSARGDQSYQLQPPGSVTMSNESSCGSDPQTGQTYRFNPQTGQPCDGLPQERVVVRQAPTVTARSVQRATLQDNPEVQQRLAAYQEEVAAMVAPMAIGNAVMESPSRSPAAEVMPPAVLGQTLSQAREGADALPQSHETEYDAQNAQTQKETFLNAARDGQSGDYLPSIRLLPLSRYEIKAGWEIPAILEQSLNSDLPGELKALVSSNVYDTATGLYLLIPQGSRLIGRYDSRVSYGQDGLQVAWSRVIYPDASSIDLNGMAGLDSHGAAGLRDTVDHHYKRLIGGVALSTLFTAGFAVSQARNQSVLSYQTPGQAASTAVGQEVNETGAQLARRNLNVQPTIKVPAGYRFTVRVNRDILFDAPYQPMPSNSLQLQPGDSQLHRRATER